MLNDLLPTLGLIVAVLVFVALVVVVRQLAVLSSNVRASNLLAAQSMARQFDQLILDDTSVRDLLHYSRTQAVAHLALRDMEAKYVLGKEGISDSATWQADQAYIKKYAQSEFVKAALANGTQDFRPDFLTFLSGKDK